MKTFFTHLTTVLCSMALGAAGCVVQPIDADDEALFEDAPAEEIGEAEGAAVSSSASEMEWQFTHGSYNYLLQGNDRVRLHNNYLNQDVVYGSRSYGINLVWSLGGSSNMRVVRQGGGGGSVTVGESVALYIEGGGYVKYGVREYGINLVWSSTPVYEWQLRGGGSWGSEIDTRVPRGLYNTTIDNYVVYCVRSYGINLRWSQDCTRCASYGGCSSGGTTMSTTYVCGIGGCPGGYHSVQYYNDSGCSGYSTNATMCQSNTGLSFVHCAVGVCPAGYHVYSTQFTNACWLGSSSTSPNSTMCVQN
jgi:hypothetical protein